MRVGVSTHIHVYEKLDRALLSNISRAGFESVELYCNHPHWPEFDQAASRRKIAGICNDLGLPVNSIHTPFFRTIEDARMGRWYSLSTNNKEVRRESIDRTISSLLIAENTTVKAAVVHVGCPPEDEDANTWERLYYSLEEVLEVSGEIGITISLENITNNFSRGHQISKFIEESKLDGVGCCYDSGHATIYQRTVDELKEMAPFLVTTHIHDSTDGKDNHLMPFEGDIDWKSLAEAFAEIEYDGDLIIETKDVEGTFDTLVKAAEAGKNLREMIDASKQRKSQA